MLLGIVIVLGMLVDDAVVLVEAMYTARNAALESIDEVCVPASRMVEGEWTIVSDLRFHLPYGPGRWRG